MPPRTVSQFTLTDDDWYRKSVQRDYRIIHRGPPLHLAAAPAEYPEQALEITVYWMHHHHFGRSWHAGQFRIPFASDCVRVLRYSEPSIRSPCHSRPRHFFSPF